VGFLHQSQCFLESCQGVQGDYLNTIAQVALRRGEEQVRKGEALAWPFHSQFRHPLRHLDQALR
jgi:hypothetical protein